MSNNEAVAYAASIVFSTHSTQNQKSVLYYSHTKQTNKTNACLVSIHLIFSKTMTTQTLQSTSTKTFIVRYEVTTYHAVEVERPENITEAELLSSITRDELMSGEEQNDCGWDRLKSSWREGNAEVYVYDEDDCYEDAFAE